MSQNEERAWRQIQRLLLVLLIAAGGLHARGQGLSRTNLLEYVDGSGHVAAVRSLADWERRRASILRSMQEVMGPLPSDSKRCPLDVRVDDEVDCGTYVRRCLSYAAEPGSRVPAYLLVPKRALSDGQLCPGVLCLHQTHALGQEVVVGLGGSPNDEYGVELAERGYVCLAPAYPLLVNYYPDLKQLGYASGTMKAIWNNIRGLDLLDSLPYVRKGGYGVIGHSLGGHNGIFTAVFDPRLKVAVSSCGVDAFRHYMGGNIRGWGSDRYMPRLLQFSAAQVPFDFDEVIGALAPRVCFLSAPLGDSNFHWWSVDEIFRDALPVYERYGVPQHLQVEHPNCGHLFPREMRELAYTILDRTLRDGVNQP